MNFSADIFDKIIKAYDIRGLHPEQINEDFAYAFGRAFVAVTGTKEVAIGRDARVSSDSMYAALSKGIKEQGADVINLGQIGTDMVYFACGKFGYETGIMITASHNPKEYNGLKCCYKNAAPLPSNEGDEFNKIRKMLLEDNIPAPTTDQGSEQEHDIMEPWIEHLMSFFDPSSIQPMKIVVDAGNGMAGPVVEKLFKKIPNIELIPMYFEPDGSFPNHPANPIEESNLQDLKEKMKATGADLGMAFDGDADRVFLVDKNGSTIPGTIATAMVAEMLLKKHGPNIVLYNAICGRVVPEKVKEYGGTPIRTRVGHTFIKQAMKEHNALFAGEHSGHYFFRDNWYADSGIIMAVILLEMINNAGVPLHELRKEFQTYCALEETNFTVTDIPKILGILKEEFKDLEQDELDGLSIHAENWWANIRPSNTEPLLRLNIEARTYDQVREIAEHIQTIIEENK